MDSLAGKRVVVTGGCGFIGTNLVNGLVEAGAKVTALDMPSADWQRLPRGVRRVKADIREPRQLRGVFDGSEVVYHLAARTDVDGKTLDDYAANMAGTENVLRAVGESGSARHFIFYSTILVTGIFNDTRFIDETEPYRTNTLYGQSKIDAERIVTTVCKEQRLDYTIIRPASVYGPWGEDPYRDFFAAIKRRRYANIGKADNLVSWVYVKNLVDQTIGCTFNQKAIGRTFYGSDLHPYTMKEIVSAVSAYYEVTIRSIPVAVMTIAAYGLGVFKLAGANVPLYPFRLRNIRATYCYSMERSVAAGHVQRYDLRTGITETLDWYEAHGLL